ncbi:MAG: thioredoxin family protein [Myxococcales bacterium]|nr:thioredoxin family protein [Myxococcales bacterium]
MRRLGGVALVIITSQWCGACKLVKRALASVDDEALASAGLEPDALHLLELDAVESAGLVADLEVFHLPSMFVYRDGEYHAPLHAPARADALVDALARALAAPPVEPP